MKQENMDCTAMLVGKNASMDGSTMVARDEDGHDAVQPKRFITYPATTNEDQIFRFYNIWY